MANKTKKPSKKVEKAEKPSKTKTPAVAEHEKVPEAAENIEHTLRRINAEKEKKRRENPGLYL